MILMPGANAALESLRCEMSLTCSRAGALGEYAGLALLAVDDKRQPVAEPALMHTPQPWVVWHDTLGLARFSLALEQLPAHCERVLLVLYVFGALGPLRELGAFQLKVGEQIEHGLALEEYGDGAMVIAEVYRRNDQWKIRALAEASAYGLSAFARRMGLTLDDRHPLRTGSEASDDKAARQGSTGTGFAVSAQHILTCAHVIEGLDHVSITSFEGRYKAEPVVVDRKNDLALLRIIGAPPLSPVTFREGMGCELGESVVTLGFPLAGLAGGGVQVSQGVVSGLFGLRDDASLMQFTAPIQPGSSGSPVFDPQGLVSGLVTSTMADAQNMNFAVKSALLLAFLEAARVPAQRGRSERSLSTPELVRAAQSGLWRIDASHLQ